ncbi:MAG: class I SAM-dependent methyltransferase [Anaerolineae bacterium]|nr:class I SAM-dependent methyltransferase [Anaerolineae bacterium]
MATPYSHSVLSPRPAAHSPDLEHVVCDYCGADHVRMLARLQPPAEMAFPMHRLGAQALQLAGMAVHFVRCLRCGLVYMNPRLTEPAIARFYDMIYARPGAAAAFESDQARHTAYILDQTARLLARAENAAPPKHLDIGCGAGQLLAAAQARGWQVYGSEVSTVAAERASARLGVAIHVGDFRDMALEPASLDVVTLLAVLEHVRTPVDYVRDAAALLRPGGVLVIEAPNVASLEFHVASALGQTWRGFIIEHLSYFTPRFMRRLLADLGMDIIVLTSRIPWTRVPNPFRDAAALLRRPESASGGDQAPPGREMLAIPPLPPLPPASLPRRIVRQANNYALDTLSWLSDQGGARGNTLIVWARRVA